MIRTAEPTTGAAHQTVAPPATDAGAQLAPDAQTVMPVTVPGAATVGPAVSATPATATPTTQQAQPQPLPQQLARPLFTLANAGHGDHVVTVTVVPETLGQVTVRAHVSAQGMHVEMFAASDAGREAVRAVLPDLRRDMGQAGISTTLDLSSQNQPSAEGHDLPRQAATLRSADTGREARPAPATPATAVRTHESAGLDVLA